jgi:hypothetical protein
MFGQMDAAAANVGLCCVKPVAEERVRNVPLALQLPFRFEVGSLGDRLMSSTPE